MLTELCEELKNWFVGSDNDKKIGVFEISGGVIMPPIDLKENQYFRIIGSVFNDGVHKYGDTDDVLVDEEFDGAIWLMRVPPEIVTLASKISEYELKYGEVTPFTNESFGGYSYSKKEDSNWKNAFSAELSKWRKI